MTLREAAQKVLRANKRPMTAREIVDAVNAEQLYIRRDGSEVPISQINAMVYTYCRVFDRINGKIVLMK